MEESKRPRPYRNHARLIGTGIALCAALLAAACSSGGAPAGGGTGASGTGTKTTQVTLGVPQPNAANSPLWYGQSLGIFAKHGISLRIATLGGGTAVTAALTSGSIDIGQTLATTILTSIGKGVPIISVGGYNNAIPEELVANVAWAKAHGLTASSSPSAIVHALAGTQIGANSASVAGHITALLKSENVDPASVKILTIQSQTTEESLLESGKLDAFVAGPPLPNQIQASGRGVVLIGAGNRTAWSHSGINLAIAVKSSWAQSNSALLSNFLTALQESEQAFASQTDAAIPAVLQHLSGTTKQDLLDEFPILGFTTCPRQSAAQWNEVIATGVLGGLFPAGTTAAEGKAWTNQYIKSSCIPPAA
jgi:NitT/TauT family transport system substrate-binding protein